MIRDLLKKIINIYIVQKILKNARITERLRGDFGRKQEMYGAEERLE